MARMREPRFKKCRRLDLNVCGHPKAMKRAGNGQSRATKIRSNYGRQLLEKQRLRAYYEVMEKQFVIYVKQARKSKGVTADELVNRLECRLDNMVYRIGLGSTIRQARQMVVHGHILVNDKKVDIPSYKISIGDVIRLREKSKNNQMFNSNFISDFDNSYPYIEKEKSNFAGKLLRLPKRHEVPIIVDDHLVIEYYSKVL